MEVNEFNSLLLNTFSVKLFSGKNKEIVLIYNFNIDLLKNEKDHNASDFKYQIYSTLTVPHITSSTWIILRSRTLIDNVFSTDISENLISGNIVTSISDHLTPFLHLPTDQFTRNHNRDIYQRNFKHLINKHSWRIFKT